MKVSWSRFAAAAPVIPDLPPAVVETAKEIAPHAWAVQLAGSTLPWSQIVIPSTCRTRRHRAEHGVGVTAFRTPTAAGAAFANGAFGHVF